MVFARFRGWAISGSRLPCHPLAQGFGELPSWGDFFLRSSFNCPSLHSEAPARNGDGAGLIFSFDMLTKRPHDEIATRPSVAH